MRKVLLAKPNPSLPRDVWQALDYCICVSSCWTKHGTVYIDLLDADCLKVEHCFQAVRRSKGEKSELMGYELADENTTEIKRLFDANPRAARAIAIKLAVNIALGYPVPDGLRAFTGLLLIGEVAMTKPRAVKPSLAHRDYLLVGLAKCIQSEIGLPLASNSAVLSSGKPRPVTASVLAAASLYVHGAAVNIEQAARIIYENGKSRQRIDIHGPIFFPESLPLYGNALASRFSRFDMEGLDVLRQKAVDWLASSL